MLSKTCEYVIRALVFIAQQTKDGSRIGIKEIAKGIDSPVYFIAKILQNLGKKDFVQSVKGPNGGFYLTEENLERPLSDVVREIDGDKIFDGCVLGLKECSNDHPCPMHSQFLSIRTKLISAFENSKIGKLSDDLDDSLTFLRR